MLARSELRARCWWRWTRRFGWPGVCRCRRRRARFGSGLSTLLIVIGVAFFWIDLFAGRDEVALAWLVRLGLRTDGLCGEAGFVRNVTGGLACRPFRIRRRLQDEKPAGDREGKEDADEHARDPSRRAPRASRVGVEGRGGPRFDLLAWRSIGIQRLRGFLLGNRGEDRGDALPDTSGMRWSEGLERGGELGDRRVSLERILCEAGVDDLGKLQWHVGAQLLHGHVRILEDHRADDRHGLGIEWDAARHELVEANAERPDVGPEVDVARSTHLLGRHVLRRAHDGGRRGKGRVAHRDLLREPEVEDLHAWRSPEPAREKEVSRLEVTMDDGERVRLGDRLACLKDVVDRFGYGDRPT